MCETFAGQNPKRYYSETRRVRMNGQSISIRLELSFRIIIDEIAASQQISTPKFISQLHSEVLELRGEAPNFTSLLKCACLIHLGGNGAPDSAQAAAPGR
ncbi:MAG: ribbon-helix-helix domain-containing protein [Hyphomicrobiales bacterium]